MYVCMYGVSDNPGEMGAESGGLCRRFLLPSHPRQVSAPGTGPTQNRAKNAYYQHHQHFSFRTTEKPRCYDCLGRRKPSDITRLSEEKRSRNSNLAMEIA